MTSRQRFEQWYATNAFDYVSNPIGSRECGLQWKAWQAAERDTLERCVYEAEQGFRRALDGNEIADKLKELLNEQH